MTSSNIDETRKRVTMFRYRKKMNDGYDCVCDKCGVRVGGQRHHIVPRYSVMGNDKAKEYQDSVWLTSMLCPECHSDADTYENRDIIYRKLKEIYGSDIVRTTMLKLQRATNMLWNPEEEDEIGED